MATKKTSSFDATPLLDIINTSGPRGPLWERLCAAIDEPATLRAAPLWLPQVTAQLDATWDDRERVWPLKWLTRKDPHPAASIVRHLRLDDITAAQQAKVLAHLAQLDASTMPPITSFEADGEKRKRKTSLNSAAAEAVWAALRDMPLRHVAIYNNVEELNSLVESMADQPALRGVESLTLDYISDAALTALAAASALGALKRFELRHQPALTAPGCEALCALLSGQLGALRLHCMNNMLQGVDDGAAWRALWAAPWPALRVAALSLSLHAPLSMMLGATPALEGLRIAGVVLDGGGSTTLRTLELSSVAGTDAELARLLDDLGGLRELALGSRTPIGALTAAAIGRLTALRSFELRHWELGAEVWEVLGAASFARLESLALRAWVLGQSCAVVEVLGRAHMPALKVLDLRYMEMTDEQIEAVATLRLPDGVTLKYGPHNSYGDKTARKLDARLGRDTRET